MDEHLPDSYGPPTAYAPAEVQQLAESDRWQSLAPNAYSPDHDLLPRDLDAEQLNTLVETLMADPNLAAFQQDGREASATAADAFKSRDLGEMGTLSMVDNGVEDIIFTKKLALPS